MDERILEAARALCLSPRRRDRFDRTSPLKPSAALPQLNTVGTASSSLVPDALAPSKAIAKLATATGSTLPPDATMPRGVKRPRRAFGPAQSSISISELPPARKLARYDTNPAGLSANDPIVISDFDDDDLVDNTSTVEASLANRFTYRSLTKARVIREPEPETLPKSESLKPLTSATELFKPPTSPTKLLSIPKTDTSASDSIAESSATAQRKSKATKGTRRATIQMKKTLEAAKAAGVAPLRLDRVLPHGFRLIARCSFCAGLFAKSISSKPKQQHMSFCAPLHGVELSATAVDMISSDITSARVRDEEVKKKQSEERTVLQDVMHDADIVMHEGRASQIATSPKKRGKDKVTTKKAIKHSTRPQVLVAEDPETEGSPAPRAAAHSLLPARKAMLPARDVADQLLGSVISVKTQSSKSEVAGEKLKAQVHAQPSDRRSDANLPSTPKETRTALFSPAHVSDHADPFNPGEVVDEENSHEESTLPLVSAEQVFASMASSSPHKSPVKALQKSRERQVSGEYAKALTLDGFNQSPGSPSLPRTQPFAPSKLAQRRQNGSTTAREKLFGAQTTKRSLRDLVQSHRDENICDTSGKCKRKADDNDHMAPSSVHTKKARLNLAELKPSSADSGSIQSDESHALAAADDDMDVDDQTSRELPSTQRGKSMGKLQEGLSVKANSGSAIGMAGTDEKEEHASSPPQQTALKGCSTKQQDAAIDTGDSPTGTDAVSLDEMLTEEDDDEDTQSFLDLLEPLQGMHQSVVSPTHSLSDPLSYDLDESDATQTAYKSRRMLVACGGASTAVEHRRKGNRSALPSSFVSTLHHLTQRASPHYAARESSVSNSDPDLVRITDDSCDSSPRP
ncbi:hypothetical protein [Sporisorium scitamineum]|uniref:Uncharacterized protein n=1 Tax=Sporisorium scitamineum TaxID=49012 RepID=A0A0F7RZT5_9BASI|nr:hypothetical protein [Sporisorium scitamineum]